MPVGIPHDVLVSGYSIHSCRMTRVSSLESLHLLLTCTDTHQSVNAKMLRSVEISVMIITEAFL